MESLISTLTSKGQVTIPKSIRVKLSLGAGDKILFEETKDSYLLKKFIAADLPYLEHLDSTLSPEWNCAEDNEAYDSL